MDKKRAKELSKLLIESSWRHDKEIEYKWHSELEHALNNFCDDADEEDNKVIFYGTTKDFCKWTVVLLKEAA